MNTGKEYDICRLLIERRNGSEILLIATGHGLSLPAVEIPRWERVAPHVINALKEIWNVEAYCLFSPASGHSAGETTDCKYQLVETCQPDAMPPNGWCWIAIESLSENMFANLRDFLVVHSALDELAAYANGSIPGFFGKPQWLRELFAWIEQEIVPLGLRLTGQFRQLNASPTFSLIRMETNGPALWFKAVGEPNLREYSITLTLAKLFPNCIPRIIATRPECNAWLATEAQGTHPDANSSFDMWITVAQVLADLQIASFGQTLHLVDAGCRDMRLCSLVDIVQPFLEVMAGLMEQQTKVSPARLSRTEIHTLGAQLQEALSIFDNSGLPNALGHLDFNPGNILVSGNHCVFLDWAEACAGHPFVTFQYLLEHLRRLCPVSESWEPRLLSAYTAKWRFFVEPKALTETIAVARLLAPFTYAIAGGAWREPTHLACPDTARHLRSLTRRMKSEADALRERMLTCLA